MIVELFCCGGGMSEGLRRAGLHVDLPVDYNPDACDTYAANLGHRPLQMDVRDLLRLVQAGWKPSDKAISLFVADPPCQPWSRAGKRKGEADERDLLAETCDLIRLLRPALFLLSNVPGLCDKKNWRVVQRTIGSLGPAWCVDFAMLDAANYGVPQHRLRPFWVGHPTGEMDCPAPTMGGKHRGQQGASALRLHPRKIREDRRQNDGAHPARSITGRDSRDETLLQWPWNRPATTVQADSRLAPPGHHGESFMSDERGVLLSEKAAAIIQDFPENWVFCGKTKKARWAQLGMAMPPGLARAVGSAVVEAYPSLRNL